MYNLEKKDINRIRYAIVEQAKQDFIYYKKTLYKIEHGYIKETKNVYRQKLEWELDEVIDFFYSEWFTLLFPKVDPQSIIDMMDSIFDEWVVRYEKDHLAKTTYGIMKHKLTKI